MEAFVDFFKKATGFDPFPYQVDFAQSSGEYSLLNVPTGAGKTATVILSWL